jgi:hypothetical protein
MGGGFDCSFFIVHCAFFWGRIGWPLGPSNSMRAGRPRYWGMPALLRDALFAEEEDYAFGVEGDFFEDGEFGLGDGLAPLVDGPGGGVAEAHDEGEFGGVVVFVEAGGGGGFDEEEMGFGEIFGDGAEHFDDAGEAGFGVAGAGFGGEVGGDETVEFAPELAGDADAVEDALGVDAGVDGIGGDGDEAFVEGGGVDGVVAAADEEAIGTESDADEHGDVAGEVEEEIGGAAGEVEDVAAFVFFEEGGDGGVDFDGVARGLRLGDAVGFAEGGGGVGGFEAGEEVFDEVEDGFVGAEEFEEAVFVFEECGAFGGEGGLFFFEGDKAGGGEVVEEGFEDFGGHVGAGGVDEGVEAFILVGEFVHAVEDAGVFEGPPDDEGGVAGDEALGGLLGEFSGIGEQRGPPIECRGEHTRDFGVTHEDAATWQARSGDEC